MQQHRAPLFWSLLTLTAIAAIYHGVGEHLFVYDSLGYVWENPHLRNPTSDDLIWLLFNSYRESWQPVTWLTHMLDFAWFGEWAGGHHIVNVVWHAVVCLLLFAVIQRVFLLAGESRPFSQSLAGVAMLLFAIHPLHVESVNMVYERRDMVYSAFLLGSTYLYLHYRNSGRVAALILSLFLYGLSLMAKPMAVTFPVLLVILEVFCFRPQLGLKLLLDKIPFLVLSLPVIYITVVTQGEAIAGDWYPWIYRPLNVLNNLWFFTTQFVLPTELSPYYPMVPIPEMMQIAFWGPGLLLVLSVTVGGIWLWRLGHPGLLTIAMLFLVSFSPSSGLVHTGGTATADHYVYLSLAAFCTGAGWLFAWLMQRIDRNLVAVMGVSVVFSLVLLSRSEISHWRSPLTLWHHVLEISPGAIVPRNNLALTYVLIGEFDLAREHIALLPEPFHSRLNQMLLEEMASQGSP